MFDISPILATDSYKFGHWRQLPPGTEFMRSYFESRGGEFANMVTAGALNYYVHDALSRPVTLSDIDEAEAFCNDHFGKPNVLNRQGWEHIVKKHGGYLPLRVRAVPEGLIVPVSNVLLTVENTDPETPWLTNYLETRLSNMWYPYTVATLSNACRQIILDSLEKTGDPAGIDFKLHDFGYRGVSSQESAAVAGWAHLTNFMGTDTVAALLFARRFYGMSMAGYSIDATEHSTVTIWGKEHEVDAYRHYLEQYHTGMFACVSDSYNIYEACEKLWGEILRDEVLKRDGVLVIRPDSGHPPTVVLRVLEILGRKFGYTVNGKGYKVLNPKVRIIQGDGCDRQMIDMILAVMEINGWSADNIAFGMGGGLLQKLNRDTMKFAFKCSSAVVNGQERDVFKSPVDDPGKNSKRGRLSLYLTDTGDYVTGPLGATNIGTDMMRPVYENGNMAHNDTMSVIRERLRVEEQHFRRRVL